MRQDTKESIKTGLGIFLVLGIIFGLIASIIGMIVPEPKARASTSAPEVVCWTDHIVLLYNVSAFTEESDQAENGYVRYAAVEVLYHLTDQHGQRHIKRGPRFFSIDTMKYWARYSAGVPNCNTETSK